jgi:cation:H+ antiporter
LAASVFVAVVALSLAASAVLVVRLERVCARLGLSAALLGLLAALAADTPEITSAITALASGQRDIGTGVVLGSNVFNLAALIGLGAVLAGGIRLHRRVVILEGSVALWIVAITIAAITGLITPALALALALAALAPYAYVSALHPSGRSSIPAPARLRSWLAEAVTEEEQEISQALLARKGGVRDACIATAALIVVLAASTIMERIAATLGTRFAVPEVITGGLVLAAVTSLPNAVAAIFLARRGQAAATLSEALNSNTLNVLAGLLIPAVIVQNLHLGDALRTAIWYGALTLATVAIALAGRGVSRRSGFLIIYAYGVFVVTVVITAIRLASSPATPASAVRYPAWPAGHWPSSQLRLRPAAPRD